MMLMWYRSWDATTWLRRMPNTETGVYSQSCRSISFEALPASMPSRVLSYFDWRFYSSKRHCIIPCDCAFLITNSFLHNFSNIRYRMDIPIRLFSSEMSMNYFPFLSTHWMLGAFGTLHAVLTQTNSTYRGFTVLFLIALIFGIFWRPYLLWRKFLIFVLICILHYAGSFFHYWHQLIHILYLFRSSVYMHTFLLVMMIFQL